MIEFVVEGKPKGKGRPRFTSRGKWVRAYTPAETAEYEAAIQRAFLEAKNHADFVKFADGTPCALFVVGYFEPPKSVSKKRRQELLSEGEYMQKPDGDNILKIVCDALNGLAFDDDKQVSLKIVRKRYAENNGLQVYIGGIAEIADCFFARLREWDNGE